MYLQAPILFLNTRTPNRLVRARSPEVARLAAGGNHPGDVAAGRGRSLGPGAGHFGCRVARQPGGGHRLRRVQDFAGHVCIGTTAWISCHVPFKKTNLLDYLATMPSALAGRNMVTAEQGAAGKCLQSLVDNWLFPPEQGDTAQQRACVYREVERLAAGVPPGSEGLFFLPWLNGAGPPTGDDDNARRILEPVAAHRPGARGAGRDRRRGLQSARAARGGRAVRRPTLCRVELHRPHGHQRRLVPDAGRRAGAPIRRMADPGVATSRGAALAALVAIGRISVDEIPSLVAVERTFRRGRKRARLYSDLFATWLASYKATRPLFRRLQRIRRSQAAPNQSSTHS